MADQSRSSGGERRDLVVVGASAGGVQALQKLAAQLPADLPAAVLVTLHIGAHASTLDHILAGAGPLPAGFARAGEALRPGRIYVAPPDRHLLVSGGHAQLTRGPKEHHTRPAIDPLFRSAALHAGPRVVAVLLTGRLDDGSAGAQAVKQCGGCVVVQDPADAEEPEMPLAALASVEPDACVPLAGIGAALLRLLAEPPRRTPPDTPALARLRREQHLMDPGGDAMDELQAIAEPAMLVCPDCNGPLWQVKDTQPPRFRCHTGHGYSMRSLGHAQAEATEQALWNAIRALQERERLLRKVAALERSAGDEARARVSDAEADTAATHADSLRKLVESETG